VHFDVKPTRQSVDNRRTNAVQPACRVIGASAELAASVQFGEDHLYARQTGPWFDVDRYATALVSYRYAAVRAQCDEDLLAITPKRLVDRVVDDLPQTVHQPPGIGRADVHRGPLPDCLKTLQHQQVPRLILTAFRCWAGSWHGLRVPRDRRPNGAKWRQSGL